MQDPVFIVECPTCSQKYRYVREGYNTASEGKLWSDGYRETELIPGIPLMACCDECSDIFRVSPSEELLTSGIQGFESDYHTIGIINDEKIPVVRRLTAEEYAEVLAKRKYKNQEEERYLRMHLWWSINHHRRDGDKSDISHYLKTILEENLETLIYKTPPDNQENLIILAELHRELGQFNEARQYLDKVNDDKYENIVSKLRDKIINRDKRVFPF